MRPRLADLPEDIRPLFDPASVTASSGTIEHINATMAANYADEVGFTMAECLEEEPLVACQAMIAVGQLFVFWEEQELAPTRGVPNILMVADHPDLEWEMIVPALSMERAKAPPPPNEALMAHAGFASEARFVASQLHLLCREDLSPPRRRLDLADQLLSFTIEVTGFDDLPPHDPAELLDPWPYVPEQTRKACLAATGTR